MVVYKLNNYLYIVEYLVIWVTARVEEIQRKMKTFWICTRVLRVYTFIVLLFS